MSETATTDRQKLEGLTLSPGSRRQYRRFSNYTGNTPEDNGLKDDYDPTISLIDGIRITDPERAEEEGAYPKSLIERRGWPKLPEQAGEAAIKLVTLEGQSVDDEKGGNDD